MKIAIDRSLRSIDADGRMRVEVSNISKAVVNKYLGSEIPDFESLGLDGDRVYSLYRDPAELEKAAATFNSLPILSRHVSVVEFDAQKELVVGSTGTDCEFVAPYLRNSLIIWDAAAIVGIERRDAAELSSGYRFRAVMESGNVDGVAYDGRMVDIIGNHVALVDSGRAGPDVVVADRNSLENYQMAKKLSKYAVGVRAALAAAVRPKLAQDAKIDLTKIVDGVTLKNRASKTAAIAAGVVAATKGKLAQDAEIQLSEVVEIIKAVECGPEMEDDTLAAIDSPLAEQIRALVEGKVDDETLTALSALLAKLPDAAPKTAEDELPKGEPDAPPKPEAGAEKPVTKTAMDAALKSQEKRLRENFAAIDTAKREVRSIVGDIVLAQDSAEEIYRFALEQKGVDLTDVPASAYRALVTRLPDDTAPRARIAQDSAGGSQFAKRFPGASRFNS